MYLAGCCTWVSLLGSILSIQHKTCDMPKEATYLAGRFCNRDNFCTSSARYKAAFPCSLAGRVCAGYSFCTCGVPYGSVAKLLSW